MMISKASQAFQSVYTGSLLRQMPGSLSFTPTSYAYQSSLWRQSMRTFSNQNKQMAWQRTLRQQSGIHTNLTKPSRLTALRQFSSISLEGGMQQMCSALELAASYGTGMPRGTIPTLTLCEQSMCVRAISDVVLSQVEAEAEGLESKILDFGAGSGQVGQLLSEAGFTQIYGQEGCKSKSNMLLKKGLYRDIESFIVGKQGMPSAYRRTFDVVTCAGGLGTNLLPARCFDDMLTALRPSGHVVFTVSQKHLTEEDSFGTGYAEAINRLISRGSWSPVAHIEFNKQHGAHSEERYSLLVFKKE